MLTIRAMSDGKGYSARHLEHNDYYAEGERVVGEWFGRGADMLGLNGVVSAEQFEAVRQGLDPRDGEFLRARRSADRASADGSTIAQGRNLYDFTFSAPKSVSVLAVLGEDRRLINAHRTAVAEAMAEMESSAAARVRKGGANEDRATGNMTVAVYHHDTSRELDPQIHTHAVAANLTFDGAEDRWKALQASAVYEQRAYLTEVYRNALAREVRALGYGIESRRDAKGRDAGFEIRGVPPELLQKFSQRSAQRDRAIAEFVKERGREPSDNEVAVLVRESRADKLAEISTEDLRARQRSRLTREDERVLEAARCCRSRSIMPESTSLSLAHAKDHVFERVSVAVDHEVLTEALRHGRGRVRLPDLKGELAVQESNGGIPRSGKEVATAESLGREKKMIDGVNRGLGSFEPLGRGLPFVPSAELRPEQVSAIDFLLHSRDRAVAISGAAGTGKTATLRELRRGLMQGNRGVLAVAPTMSAVEELQKVGFAGAVTMERLLQDSRLQAETRGQVVILDEAGMISARQMAEFLELAQQRALRIGFSGDTRQIRSVEAGDALRILERESCLKSVALIHVQRQSKKEYRDAIEELRRNPDRGFAKLEAIGAVREVNDSERAQTVAAAFQAGALVVCATHDEIDRVTDAIRDRRKEEGDLATGTIVARHVSLNWTNAQKGDLQNYQPGMILGFHRSVKGIAKNESAEVLRVTGNGVVVRSPGGAERTLTGKQASSFDVLESRPVEVSAGDRLLLTANRREPGLRFTNGELVTVAGVDLDGRIQLDDGRTVPANYRHFAHGYAVTAHRSQGKSVDSVIISADGMQKELFYVAASRGRQSVTVITSDKQRLKQTVAQSMTRKSASELMRGAPRCRPRGISMARDFVRRAAEFVASIPQRLARHLPEPRKEHRRVRDFSR